MAQQARCSVGGTEVSLRIDDMVVHVSYPMISGTIVGRYRNPVSKQNIYLVLWNHEIQKAGYELPVTTNQSSSRHIGSALRKLTK